MAGWEQLLASLGSPSMQTHNTYENTETRRPITQFPHISDSNIQKSDNKEPRACTTL